jgi:hypothetical protein
MAVNPFNNVASPIYADPEENMDELTDEEASMESEGMEESYELSEEEEDALEMANLPFEANLAEYLEDSKSSKIAKELMGSIVDDLSSRSEWEKVYEQGMELLGLTYEERTEPFDGATGVTHPILNEAVTQFQAQSYKELLPPGGPVRTQILGKVTPEKEAQAERVKAFLNYQITQVMEEYDPDYDQMLFYVGYGGSAFKKVSYDSYLDRATSPYVLPKDLIVPYSARDLMTAERVTHVLRYTAVELKRLQLSGFYRDVEVGKPTDAGPDSIKERMDRITGIEPSAEPNEYVLYECHCYLDLEGFEDKDEEGEETGLMLPYVVTFEASSNKVLAIRRNWDSADPKKKKKQYFVHYKFLPGMGFYGFGMVHLLGNLSRSATSILRQLIDAGTLSNLPAGFKAKGLRVEDQSPIQPGEWRDVDAPGGDLAQSLLPLPYKEPSATLMQLLGFCIDATQKFIGTTDLGMGDSNQEMPVGTAMAMLERGSRIMSAVHKRLHYAQMQELKLIARVVADYLPPEYPYEVSGGDMTVKASDFDDRIDIVPVSDPNIFSMTQRVTLAQQQLQLAQQAPQMHNLYEAYRRMYNALGVTDVDLILPPPPQPQPESPALENARSMVIPSGGQPLKAFPDQDHLAHIETHIMFMQLPLVQMSPPVYGVLMSHLLEHMSLAAQQMVVIKMQQAGVQMQLDNSQMQIEVAKAEAQMMQQLMQRLAPPQQGDPLVQLQQQNLQLKAQDLQMKAARDAQQMQLDAEKMRQKASIDREKTQSQEDIAQLRANVALARVAATKRQ